VADQQGSGAVVVTGGWWEEEGEALDFAVNHLKGDLFPDLMDYVGGRGCPQRVIPIAWSRRIKAWAWLVISELRFHMSHVHLWPWVISAISDDIAAWLLDATGRPEIAVLFYVLLLWVALSVCCRSE
jgi:hypothetical protein